MKRAEVRIAAIVLAAGFGRRMAGGNKLLLQVGEKPLVCHPIDAALMSEASPVIVVIGHDGASLRRALGHRPVITADNRDFGWGQSASIRAGLALVPPSATGMMFIPGDMPFLKSQHINRIIDVYVSGSPRAIIVPRSGGQLGSPVLWPSDYREALRGLRGDKGGRSLFTRYANHIQTIAFDDDPCVLIDIDTSADLAAFGDQLRACKKASESAWRPGGKPVG